MTDDRKPWASSRESRHKRGYGRRHVELRAQMLQQEPLCRECKKKGRVTAATIADHITSLAKRGAAYDFDNMQPLCRRCHDKKTLVEQGKRPRPTIGPDGWPVDD
jgi:5-methylcytosine-specific restriction enzyme A